MNNKHIKFHKLFFTGSGIKEASIGFGSGLNIIYGGSNAGKSFILRALDFMLGADKLDIPREGKPYDLVFLWLELPNSRKVTLRRAVKGGGFLLFDNFLSKEETELGKSIELKPNAKGKELNLSKFILEEIEIKDAEIAKNQAGEKNKVSLRLLAHHILVTETEMIGEQSPIAQKGARLAPVDQSLFRFLMTGQDDSSIVTIPSQKHLKASNDGKIELLKDMLKKTNKELNKVPEKKHLQDNLYNISLVFDQFQETAIQYQSDLEGLIKSRRESLEDRDQINSKISDLKAMHLRFLELKTVYNSDLERLSSMEEIGFLLQKFAVLDCPLCGSDPDHQNHNHDLLTIEEQRHATTNEIKKINKELFHLENAINELDEEIKLLTETKPTILLELSSFNRQIKDVRPLELNSRMIFKDTIEEKTRISKQISVYEQKQEYEDLLVSHEDLKFKTQKASGLEISIDSQVANDFSKVIKRILKKWKFPDVGEVHFDLKAQDIVVNGRERKNNGKGVRAILHSAFKVAEVMFCIGNNLPHLGVLVLDSPLVTYRGPLQIEKIGELEEDEKKISLTTLNEEFYKDLSSSFSESQVIILENKDPPQDLGTSVTITRYSGEKGQGRQGFFPPLNS